jgi:triacylglycerol esterase/lipase EstA (alpha/beta hydrolase family)
MERILRHALVAVALLVVVGWSASEARATTLVFVHGQNSGKRSVEYIANKYWEAPTIQAATRNYQANALIISYDGTQVYWNAAIDVAAQVNAFLDRYPNERLIFVTHSYGGVVTRFIMCNGTTAAPSRASSCATARRRHPISTMPARTSRASSRRPTT